MLAAMINPAKIRETADRIMAAADSTRTAIMVIAAISLAALGLAIAAVLLARRRHA